MLTNDQVKAEVDLIRAYVNRPVAVNKSEKIKDWVNNLKLILDEFQEKLQVED